jgi:RluA family pseudouridine synthase
MGVSRRMIQKLTRASGIRLNGRPAYLGRKLRAGDVLAARLAFSEDAVLQGVPMELRIVYEDAELLVVDKPAGVLVHPVGSSEAPTLAHGIAHHFGILGLHAKVRPVHRLDRNTSGLVLFAKSAFAHQALDRQLRERQLRRSYLAIVAGVPASGEQVIDAPIGAHPHDPHLRAVVATGGDRAVTRFRVVEVLDGAALLEVELETGRTHQIRVHLANLGHPLLGDGQYGGSTRSEIGRQALHAASLAFRQPVTNQLLELTSSLPEDLEAIRRNLAGLARRPDAQERTESMSP